MVLTENSRKNIQVIRALAIIAVVMIHTINSLKAQVFIRPFLNFSVGTFIFLSAILSCNKKVNIKKRIYKVIIPYCLWTLIFVITSDIHKPYNIPLDYVKRLVFADSIGIMYYIFVYIQLTLLIPFINRIVKKQNLLIVLLPLLISPIEVIIMRLIPTMLGFEWPGLLYRLMRISFLPWFIYFYLGFLVVYKFNGKLYKYSKLFIYLFIAIIIQILEGYFYYKLGDTNCGTQLKLSALLTGCICCIIIYKVIKEDVSLNYISFLKPIGDYSFGIYFCHMLFIILLSKIPIYNLFIFPLNSILIIAISLLFVYVSKKTLRRYSFIIGV